MPRSGKINSVKRLISFFCVSFFSVQLASAQDFTLLGGELSTTDPGRFAIQLPAPNVTDNTRKDLMLNGFSAFHRLFTKVDGAGPFLINDSCGGCHVQNGKGPLRFSKSNIELSTIVVKLAFPGKKSDGSPRPVPGLGGNLQNHSVNGGLRFSPSLAWTPIKGKYPDGTAYTLRAPVVRYKIPAKKKVRESLRMSPAVIGAGLIEAIPEASILERSDPTDANNDGISGKPNYTLDKASGLTKLGRFGYKAIQTTLEQQTLAAFFSEMGVENELFKKTESSVSELDADELNRLLFYQKLAGVPVARDQGDLDVIRGKELFFEIGCENCHRSTFVTQSSTDPELDGQTIHPFSDFLLHDMGPGLADSLIEFNAKGSEWRTAPLWALGFAESISKVKALYLHDGRARSIEEAILWHGGEAKASRTAFKKLSKAERAKLLKFLKSL